VSASGPHSQRGPAQPAQGGPGVSVVIPFYNRARFAQRLFQSIIGQSLKPTAVYIVDNGSRREELEACRALASSLDWNGIRPYFLETFVRGNANCARNTGMLASTTRYVAFLDSDDWWDPLHLERSLALLESTARAAVYGGAMVHLDEVRVNASVDVNRCENPFELLFSEHSAQTSSYVVDMDRLGRNIIWDESLRRHQDFDFFLRVYYESSGWAFLATPSTHVDWDEGGAKGAIHYRSMIRFKDKWEHRIPPPALRWYAYCQLLRCHELGARRLYKNYYRRLYVKACGGSLSSRLRSLQWYVAAKAGLHGLTAVRRLVAVRRRIFGP
jgi:glycosyltransferase involved in cell wall biosynthesis